MKCTNSMNPSFRGRDKIFERGFYSILSKKAHLVRSSSRGLEKTGCVLLPFYFFLPCVERGRSRDVWLRLSLLFGSSIFLRLLGDRLLLFSLSLSLELLRDWTIVQSNVLLVHTWFLVVGMIPPLLLLRVVDIPRSLFSAVSSTQENENASCASPPWLKMILFYCTVMLSVRGTVVDWVWNQETIDVFIRMVVK